MRSIEVTPVSTGPVIGPMNPGRFRHSAGVASGSRLPGPIMVTQSLPGVEVAMVMITPNLRVVIIIITTTIFFYFLFLFGPLVLLLLLFVSVLMITVNMVARLPPPSARRGEQHA